MLKKIAIGTAIFLVLIIIFAWVASGGVGRLISRTQSISNPFENVWSETPDISFGALPWQVELPKGAPLFGVEQGALGPGYDEAKTFGDPSPHYGLVLLDASAARTETADAEYLTLVARYSNQASVSLRGWSLQSVVSGVRVPLPEAAETFSLGVIQLTAPMSLLPGETAIVVSGPSPVGASFRENRCSGYLGQFQTFTPPVERACPTPREELPLTTENLARYGDACVDFVATLPSCTFYTGLVPREALVQCDHFIGETLSYNGCVERHQSTPDFSRDTWRLFLGSPAELWGNRHDTIRLLDENGRTVDVVSY